MLESGEPFIDLDARRRDALERGRAQARRGGPDHAPGDAYRVSVNPLASRLRPVLRTFLSYQYYPVGSRREPNHMTRPADPRRRTPHIASRREAIVEIQRHLAGGSTRSANGRTHNATRESSVNHCAPNVSDDNASRLQPARLER
jgi:hypothetical protein